MCFNFTLHVTTMHAISVTIPSFRSENNNVERGYTLKKSIKPPEIPSKHIRNWVPKVLEQRRHGLELYLQTIIIENEVLPKIFLDFLNLRHFPSLPKTESCGSFDTDSTESSKLSHQPVMVFLNDPYLLPDPHDAFSNVVIEGVIHGVFYADLQPR
ncbi:sorting nexin-24 isoform X2 [Entelurus aequoreus]|uniref:sorting nexin-24 isoform X2 n=1 Tax=Entelurus aequoreus TaxID=161455 RepID=UPI002B1D2DFC|nr:sorting nexin-24 isoform X2 [Entelurus aequoreus]